MLKIMNCELSPEVPEQGGSVEGSQQCFSMKILNELSHSYHQRLLLSEVLPCTQCQEDIRLFNLSIC